MKFSRLCAALAGLLMLAGVLVQAALAPAAHALSPTGPWLGAAGPQAAHQFYGYPYPNAPDCQEDAKHPGKNCGSADLDSWGFYQGQCTSWAAYRLNQLTGAGFTNTYKLPTGQRWGDALHWATAAHTAGLTVNSTPAAGSIAWYSSDHVAVVEQVNSPTSIVISEMNVDYHDGFAVHTVTAGSGGTSAGSGWPTQFIHVKDLPKTLPAEPGALAPTNVTGTSAVLHWTDNSTNEDGFWTQYKVVGASSWTTGPTAPANAVSVPVTGLTRGIHYIFQVGAHNSVGTHWSAYIYVNTVPLPAEPTNVKAVATGGRSVALTWTDNSNNETSFVTQYEVAGSNSWHGAQSAGANQTSVTVTGLSPNTKYVFQVGAQNVAGTHWSPYSNTVSTPQVLPAQPGSPRVTSATGVSETLAWTDASDNESAFYSQYKPVGSTNWTAGPSVGANVTSLTVPGLKNGTEYVFQVGAHNSAGTHWSAYFYGWTQALPGEPTGGAAAMGATTATLTWQDNSNNENGFYTQYQVTGATSWTAGPSVGPNVTSVTIPGLSPSTKYTFQVGAENSVGTHWSAYFYGQTAAQAPPPAYHAGRQVSIDSHATGGVSGHTGPGNSYAAGPTRPVNSAIWIVCYVNGQSITGPYNTTTIWDLSDDGYYYTDAWLYTGTNGAAVPPCALRTVTIDSHATGGVSGHTGPGNAYAAGPTHAANTQITIACYVDGQSITGPYNTTTIWDLAVGGYYYTDAWLYTGTNGAAVPHC
jgi:surface antigen